MIHRAIETRYNGFHFRSRIEARWAIFFDVLGVSFQYEPEKLQLSNCRYIPDFLLFNMSFEKRLYLEIKGAPPSDDELRKAIEAGAFVAHGNVNENILKPGDTWCCDQAAQRMTFAQCIFCGLIDITCEMHGGIWHQDDYCRDVLGSIAKSYDVVAGFTDFSPDGWDASSVRHSPLIELATESARSARFESPNFQSMVDVQKQAAELLRKRRVFGAREDYERFFAFALEMSNDAICPRYNWQQRSA